MRIRTPILVLTAIAALASMMPVHAIGVSVLTCKWSGVVRVDSDLSWEATVYTFGQGDGRCSGDGRGPYDVSFTDASLGFVESAGRIDIWPTYQLTSLRDGKTRTVVDQIWSGAQSGDCTVAPFVIERRLVVRGAGNMHVCPSIDSVMPPPQPTDYPATFTWRTELGL